MTGVSLLASTFALDLNPGKRNISKTFSAGVANPRRIRSPYPCTAPRMMPTTVPFSTSMMGEPEDPDRGTTVQDMVDSSSYVPVCIALHQVASVLRLSHVERKMGEKGERERAYLDRSSHLILIFYNPPLEPHTFSAAVLSESKARNGRSRRRRVRRNRQRSQARWRIRRGRLLAVAQWLGGQPVDDEIGCVEAGEDGFDGVDVAA